MITTAYLNTHRLSNFLNETNSEKYIKLHQHNIMLMGISTH